MYGIDMEALRRLTKPEKKRLLKYPRDPTAEELAEMHSIRLAIAALAGTPPPPPPPPPQLPATVSEILQFPMPHESREHFDRLVSVIGEVKTSLSICTYVFSHEELIEAVIGAQSRLSAGGFDTSVRIILDYQQMRSSLDQVRKLLDAKIPVKVHVRKDFMLHSKLSLFDKHRVAYGSLNWTRHAFVLKEHLTIEDGMNERHTSYRSDFETMWAETRDFKSVTANMLDSMGERTCCLCTESLQAAKAKAKRDLKTAKKEIAAQNAARKRDPKTAKEIAPSQTPIAPVLIAPVLIAPRPAAASRPSPAALPPAALDLCGTVHQRLHGKSETSLKQLAELTPAAPWLTYLWVDS